MENGKDLADFAIDYGASHGASYIEARVVASRNESYAARNGVLLGGGITYSSGIAIRVLANGGMGFCSTANLTKTGIEDGIEDAIKLAKASKRKIPKVFSEEDLKNIADVLKAKLFPVDKAGCQELLIELGKYDPYQRQAELRKMFPTYKDWQGYKDIAILGDTDSEHDPKWPSIRERAKTLFYTEQGEYTTYEKRNDGSKYPVVWVFDAITGKPYKKSSDGWELHHIDFDKTNNDFDNLLWVRKNVDPDTGSSSHLTIFSTDHNSYEKRQYIALGRMIKTAFKHGYAPRSWIYDRQASYYDILRRQERRFISE